jgi:hypothetical protein
MLQHNTDADDHHLPLPHPTRPPSQPVPLLAQTLSGLVLLLGVFNMGVTGTSSFAKLVGITKER